MGRGTGIPWATASWPVIAGCSPASEGCQACWACGVAWRKANNHTLGALQATYCDVVWRQSATPDDKPVPQWTSEIRLLEDRLDWPRRWKKPERVFVCSESDLFHPSVPDWFIESVFGIMALCQQHRFIVLTKRPARMLEWFTTVNRLDTCAEAVAQAASELGRIVWDARGNDPYQYVRATKKSVASRRPWVGWPLPNVILMVTAENQARLDERVPLLLQTPAAVRGVCLEPLLASVDLSSYLKLPWMPDHIIRPFSVPPETMPVIGLDWCIVGGETGGSADRRLVCGCAADEDGWHPDPCPYCQGTGWTPMRDALHWVGSLRDQCAAADVPFWFKSWGGAKGANTGNLLDGQRYEQLPEMLRLDAHAVSASQRGRESERGIQS